VQLDIIRRIHQGRAEHSFRPDQPRQLDSQQVQLCLTFEALPLQARHRSMRSTQSQLVQNPNRGRVIAPRTTP